MPNRSDIEKQIADLQAQLDSAGDGDEVWVKDENGREFKFTGDRAASIITKFADLFSTGDGGDGGDGGQGDGGGDGGDKGAGGKGTKDKRPAGGYFGRRD